MKYLLSISIGPVQDFIATARRSRDLWFGSWLLSEVSKAAAKKIAVDCGFDALVFPSVENDDDLNPVNYNEQGAKISGSDFSVVNKIVALIETEPQQLCEGDESRKIKGIRQAMQDRIEQIREQAYKGLKRIHIDEHAAKKQVTDLIEFYWAAYPVLDDLSDYAVAREEAEALLAARKNLRNFEQVATDTSSETGWGSNRPKSSLDGLRETVIRKVAYEELSKEKLREQVGVRQGEQLCGIGLLKRRGNRRGDGSFFSTSHVAALPLLEQLTQKDRAKAKAAADQYICQLAGLMGIIDPGQAALVVIPEESLRAMRNKVGFVPDRASKKQHEVFGCWDGHLLFEERLAEFFEDDDAGRHNLGKAKLALKNFLAQNLNGERPKPYFALLHADGDRMGEAIDLRQTKGDHQEISACLSRFAKDVKIIVEEEHDGSLVYSGGDDVLAFVPLHNALFCARVLADKFRQALAEFKNKDGKSPTLSVGIAVGHHLDPLQDTLELARQAEKVAKSRVPGKNALAIIVSKRSGADWLLKGSWDKQGESDPLSDRLNWLIYLLLANELPRGVGYELRDAARRLPEMGEALRAEAMRIIGRKRRRGGEGRLTKAVFAKLSEYLNDKTLSIEDLAYQIIGARPFADAMKQAGLDGEGFAKKAKLDELREGGDEK